MKNISSHVEDFMQGYPFLSKFLRQGIVNYKALARSIEPEISKNIGEKVGVGAIAVSLQRLHARDKDKLYSLIGRLRGVRVISNVAAFHTTQAGTVYELMATAHNGGVDLPFIMVTPGQGGVTVFLEAILKPQFKALTQDSTTDSLTALVITRELLNDTEIGGLSYPLQVLAEHGILVRAASATFSEEVIIVNDDIADKAAAILRRTMWR